MHLFSNNSKMNDSLIFYLYKNKNLLSYSKSNNKIYGYYKDSILNDFIYLASNGLNVTNFRLKILQPEAFNRSSYKFVSYFSSIEDNFLRLNLYPKKHSQSLLKNYIKKKKTFSVYEERRKQSWPASKILHFFPVFIKNYQKYRHLKYLLNNTVTSSRLRFYKKKGYRFFFSRPTRLIQESGKFIYRVWFFRFISRFIPAPIRISFMPVMKMGYLIIRHLSRIFSDKFVSPDAYYNLLIYNYYFRFVQAIFRKAMYFNKYEKRGLRSSNGLVFYYFTVIETKLISFTGYISKIVKEKLFSKLLYNWSTFFIYGKGLFSYSMNLQEEHDIKTLVNVLPFDLKLYLIEKLTSKSIVYSSNKIVNFANNHVNSVYEYLLLKSFSFLCLTRNNDYFIKILKDFDFKPVTFYIYNFINSKINAFIKTFHGSQKKSFSLAVLKSSSLHTKSFKFKANTLAKIYFSYKYWGKIFYFRTLIKRVKYKRKNLKFLKFFKFFKRFNFRSKKIFLRKLWWDAKNRFNEFKDFRAFPKNVLKPLRIRFLSIRKAWFWKVQPTWKKNLQSRIKAWRKNVYKQVRRLKFRAFPFSITKGWIVYWIFKYKNRGELRQWKRLKGYREKWWKFLTSQRFALRTKVRRFAKFIRRKLKLKKFNFLKFFLKFRPYYFNPRRVPKKISKFKIFREVKRIKRFLRFKQKMYYPYALVRRLHWKFKVAPRKHTSKIALIRLKLKYSNKPYKHIKLNLKSRYTRNPKLNLLFKIGPDPERRKKNKYKGFKSRYKFNSKNINTKKNWKNKKKFFGANQPVFQKNQHWNKKQKNFNKNKKQFSYGNNIK